MLEKKLLIVAPVGKFKKTGLSVAVETLYDGLNKRGRNCSLLSLFAIKNSSASGAFSVKKIFNSLAILLKIFRQLFSHGILYLPVSSSVFGFWRDAIIIWFAFILNKKIVLHLHGGGYKQFFLSRDVLFRTFIRSTISKADKIIVLGELLKDQFDFVPNKETKIEVVPNSLPSDLDYNESSIKHLPKRGDINQILYLSNLIPSKGFLDLLEACHIVRQKSAIPFQCHFCGEFSLTINDKNEFESVDQLKTTFFEKIEEFSLQDCVFYHGTVSGNGKKEILQKAHLFILPTYYPWEGQPISIIESLAYGIPVITTNHKGISEQIVDGFNGLEVAKKDPNSLARAILKILNDSTMYETMSKNALNISRDKFSRDVHVEKMDNIIFNS